MSQAKVDLYKKEKEGRKKAIARQKVGRKIRHLVEAVVVIALVVWIGFAGYNKYQSSLPIETHYVDLSSMANYIDSLSE